MTTLNQILTDSLKGKWFAFGQLPSEDIHCDLEENPLKAQLYAKYDSMEAWKQWCIITDKLWKKIYELRNTNSKLQIIGAKFKGDYTQYDGIEYSYLELTFDNASEFKLHVYADVEHHPEIIFTDTP